MAADTKYGANYTKALINVPSVKIQRGDVSGDVKVAYDEFVFTEELEVNDKIFMCPPIPAGARIVDATAFCPNIGTTGIMTLGRTGDVDSLLGDIDGGGQAAFVKPSIVSADVGVELSADTQFFLTANEVSTAAVGKTIKVWIFYRDV